MAKAKKITIKINSQRIKCRPGQTIFQAARQNGIEIPGLCGHPDFPVKANCRLCVVEIKGRRGLPTSCSTPVEEGMEIKTDTERVKKARNLNLELIYAEHIEKCADCIWRFQCPLLKTAEKYKILITTFRDRKGRRPTHKFANAVEIDGSQCIDCRNCLDACGLLQNIHYLELKGKGAGQEIVPTKKKDIHCILCGQCAVHCPVSAAQEQSHWEAIEKALADKSKIVIAQFAPSIRVSIGEDFGLPYGKIVTGQVVSALRRLGFAYVFDVNFGADITTLVETEELLERLAARTKKNKPNNPLPMFTSCCPAWINYVEFYHPELIPHLTSARSPHIHNAGIIKTYWAGQMRLNPKNITVVSVMPCTAKKYEAGRPELKVKGEILVDYVITTREFSFMLKKNKINLATLKPFLADNPMGRHSGAAAIYGASGGVMESALRTAQFFAKKEKSKPKKIELKKIRGTAGVKEAVVPIAGVKLRVAAVNGIGNLEPIIANLDKYDYVEVMACPGGCIGGGGQPIPTTAEIRKKRATALYKLDKKLKIRQAHKNREAQKILAWLKKQNPKLRHELLHTKYKKKQNYQ